jgi:hypothetical protein
MFVILFYTTVLSNFSDMFGCGAKATEAKPRFAKTLDMKSNTAVVFPVP